MAGEKRKSKQTAKKYGGGGICEKVKLKGGGYKKVCKGKTPSVKIKTKDVKAPKPSKKKKYIPVPRF